MPGSIRRKYVVRKGVCEKNRVLVSWWEEMEVTTRNKVTVGGPAGGVESYRNAR